MEDDKYMQKKQKLVSIISPVYNGEAYIEECINSIINQTYKNFEWIIVNDGSSDNTEKIVKKYQKKYKWIKLINITNHGQGYARNIALKEAEGEFVAYLDSDDYLDKKMLEITVECMIKNNPDFVLFDYIIHDKANNKFSEHRKYDYYNKDEFIGKEVLSMLNTNAHFIWNILYKKDFLLKNNVKCGEGYIYEDTMFYVNCVINASKVSVIHDKLYYYVQNPVSTTRKKNNSNKHAVGLTNAMRDTFPLLKKSKYNEEDYRSFYSYLFRKYTSYSWYRVPKKYRKKFTTDFLEFFSKETLPYVEDDKRYNYFVKHKLFNKKYSWFVINSYITAIIAKIKLELGG